MGFIPESTPEMGEYHVEVRRESFYLRGQHNWAWVREVKKGRKPTPKSELRILWGGECEIRDDATKPRGRDWSMGEGALVSRRFYHDADMAAQRFFELTGVELAVEEVA